MVMGRPRMTADGRVKLSVSLTSADVALGQQMAAEDGTTFSGIVRQALRHYFFSRSSANRKGGAHKNEMGLEQAI